MNTTDRIAFAALGISIITLVLAAIVFYKTDQLARSGFNRNYRPYMVVASFYYIKDNKAIHQMNSVLIKVHNAPALMTSKKLKYFTKSNEGETLLFDQSDNIRQLIFPLEGTQTNMITADTIINDSVARSIAPKGLIRKIRIEYQWISDSTLKYFYGSEWKYNVANQSWDITSQDAN